MKKSIIILILFAISTCLVAQDFEVAPIRIKFINNPGDTETKTITVKNHGNRKESITLTLRDYIVQRHGDMELLPAGSTRNSITNWITLNPSFVELQPNEEELIQVTFQAPVDDYSSKWGIISFTSAIERTAYSADQNVQTGLFLSGRIDVFVSFNPITEKEPNIVLSNLREITSESDEEKVFAVNIDNLGDVITPCEIYLVSSNLETSEEQKFKTHKITTYPQSSRTLELRLPDVLDKGEYSLAAILDYGIKSNLKGTQIMIEID
ncbi:MAG: hypothetical protein ACOCWC_03665 [Bacteroidota bacterium]